MTDIVDELRESAKTWERAFPIRDPALINRLLKAADEIKRLQRSLQESYANLAEIAIENKQLESGIERLRTALGPSATEAWHYIYDENKRLRETLEQIVEWARAYPLQAFPEPDFAKAHELLQTGGISLDAVSASNMRHVVTGVAAIARTALEERLHIPVDPDDPDLWTVERERREAAAEIKRLRALVAILTDALGAVPGSPAWRDAKTALAGKEQPDADERGEQDREHDRAG